MSLKAFGWLRQAGDQPKSNERNFSQAAGNARCDMTQSMNALALKPWVLGLASSHNGGACLLHGDSIVVAIQEERLLRLKRAIHPAAHSSLSIAYCLDTAGIRAKDLDLVVP